MSSSLPSSARGGATLRFLWSFVRPDRRTVFLILVLLVLNNGFSLVEPYLFKIVIDSYLTHIGDVVKFPTTDIFVHGLVVVLLSLTQIQALCQVLDHLLPLFPGFD
jgi:ABC-type multidrug transport system fused ATPase/permease subunit